MRRFPIFLLLTLFLCSCDRDPLSVKEVRIDSPAGVDGLTEQTISDSGIFTEATELLPSHENLTLRLSYQLGDNDGATLLLQNRYSLDLATFELEGQSSQLRGLPSRGIWHDLELIFLSATENVPATVLEVYVDGNLVHTQHKLRRSEIGHGPLVIEPATGATVRVANLRTAGVARAGATSVIEEDGEVNLEIPLLSYAAYATGGDTEAFTDWQKEPDERGYVQRFDVAALNPGTGQYALRFTGKLNVPKSGKYWWNILSPSTARFFIDGEEVLSHDGDPGPPTADSLQLAAGDHDVALEFTYRGGWNRLMFSYRFEDEKVKLLNTVEWGVAYGAPASSDPLPVEMDDRPYLLRSFLFFPAPRIYAATSKRTHVVSVGEGKGPHYSVDLQTGSLLQVWRGDFADVRDMWAGRGPKQIITPLGVTTTFDGDRQWTEDPDAPWPGRSDEPGEDDFQHFAYDLDEAGRPTFTYKIDKGQVSDKFTPDGDALVRDLRHTGSGIDRYTQIANAEQITEISPGEFELRSPGMRITIESYDGEGLFKQVSEGRERLIAHVGADGHLRYRINW
ncbi:PA14 domain-containing protein [Neolewinella antarctica]|uniref:PA14 domain-containing protein n=1 Tax=Neolewinella antarctica TaxID=442734 RepID=A0ABX0X8F2_9BACT|nr:PA14 domain-containing protein [Neolewinella antarctica]NJC25244.1 hypothetical protein [Neolewinella antarctica]